MLDYWMKLKPKATDFAIEGITRPVVTMSFIVSMSLTPSNVSVTTVT